MSGRWGAFERGGEPYQELLFFTVSSSASVGFEIKVSMFKRLDWAQCNDIPMIYYIKLQDIPVSALLHHFGGPLALPLKAGPLYPKLLQ